MDKKPVDKLDGYRLALLPIYIEEIESCINPHPNAIAFMEKLLLTRNDWKGKLVADELTKWYDYEKELETCNQREHFGKHY